MNRSKLTHKKKKDRKLRRKFLESKILAVPVGVCKDSPYKIQTIKKGKSGCRLDSLEMIF